MNLFTYAALLVLCLLSDIAYCAKTYYIAYALPDFVASSLLTKRNNLTQDVEEFSSNVNWVQKANMEGLIAYFTPTMQAEQLTQVEAILDEFAKKTAPYSIKGNSLPYAFVNQIYRPVSYMGMSFAQYAFCTDPVLAIFSKEINDIFLAKGIVLNLPEGQSNSVKLFYTPALYKGDSIIKKATELFNSKFATREGTLTIDKLLLKAYDDSTRKAEVYKTYALVGGAPVVAPPTGGGTEGTGDKQGEDDTVPVDKQTGYALTFAVPEKLAVEIAKTWNQSQAKLIISQDMGNFDLSIRADEMQGIIETFPLSEQISTIDKYVVDNFAQEIVVDSENVYAQYGLKQDYFLGARYVAVMMSEIYGKDIRLEKFYVKIYASENPKSLSFFKEQMSYTFPSIINASFNINKIMLKKYDNGRLGDVVQSYTLPKKVVPPPVVTTDEELKNEAINLIAEVEALVTLVK
jgi:hypothetical protein